MDLNQYWDLVDQTRPRSNSPEVHCAALTRRLRRLPPAEIIAYEHLNADLVDSAYRRDLWSVAAALNGGCSDDGFEYFLWWLVVQGRDVLETALADPDSLVEINGGAEELEAEEYGYVAMHAYQEVTGEEAIPTRPGWRPGRRRLRGRSVDSDRAFRRKFPMVHRLLGDPPATQWPWKKWRDKAVLQVARTIHQERRWAELPVLADALEEAGCDHPFVLAHLREGRRHARSCWVTYFLLRR